MGSHSVLVKGFFEIEHVTYFALIMKSCNNENHVIMKTKCPPVYHHNGFVAI